MKEHNEQLTKAAMVLLNELKEESAKLGRLSSKPMTTDGAEEWIAASWALKKNLIDADIVDLENQIITGNFDY